MGFFASLFGRSDDDVQLVNTEEEAAGTFPELYNGMTLDLETNEGQPILTGRLSGYSSGDTAMTLERLPGGLSFEVREVGSSVTVRGVSESMTQFFLKGTVQESSRLLCRLKDVKVKAIPEHRNNFRLQMGVPVTMYYPSDATYSHPEECTLVDISTGGCCIVSEYLHGEGEVLRLRVKLEDYVAMDFVGEVIRVVDCGKDGFRCGILFAQLKKEEVEALTKMLFNLQLGNRREHSRSETGHW